MLERLFALSSHRTTPGREVQAGFTTFAAMAYILAVNPSILADAGMDRAALVTVTALSAAAATALMALLTNYPLALAPGMGVNSFFTYTICIGAGVPWQQALGMVFVNGCLFLALSLTGVRERIIDAIPYSLKLAITCGIGLFIAFVGLRNGGVVVASPATFVTHGDFTSGPTALCLAGLALTIVLVARRVPGAIVIGMAATTIAGLMVPDGAGSTVTAWPAALISAPASPAPVLLQLDLSFLTSAPSFFKALPLILTLLLVDMFDNIGTLIGVAKRAGLLETDGSLARAGRVLVADSIAAILSALLGTSTVVSYIESASGVEAGGRTGLTTLTTAACFLLALVLTPLFLAVPAAATAPALIIVGVFMLQSAVEIDMRDFATAAPAALTLLAIPLTFSIAEGIGLGLVAAVVVAVGTGRARGLPLFAYLIALVFFLQFFQIFPFGQ
ncbi:MAG TPA: NCS2 family permease [Vicinamibacterales bacterium]|nr:NCS2 family permease [Vicinamibacterales bacterium]